MTNSIKLRKIGIGNGGSVLESAHLSPEGLQTIMPHKHRPLFTI